jgi:hypothetical protein
MVNKQSIHGWIAQKDQIMEGSIKRKRLAGGGRKTILDPEFEDIIIGMINIFQNLSPAGCITLLSTKCR